MAPAVVINSDDWDAFISSDDESMLAEVAQIEKAGPSKATSSKAVLTRVAPWPAAGKNNIASTSNNNVRLQQKDLFGKTIAMQQPSTSTHPGFPAGPSNPVIRTIVTKRWDRTFYAKSGAVRRASKAKAKTKGKGKGRARDDDDEDEDEDEDDGENPLFDPEEAKKPPKPMKLIPDRDACRTFIYPTNRELRKYQYDIIAKAFFTDTLVALPTGLGKTFLAAVLMFNFYRWFPKGKIIFMAPSRPLVTQQIAACHGIVGIPLKDAVELTGKDNPERRTEAWEQRRVFYCTPQTVKNDLFKGRLDPSDVILMVVDEAHKATGDYAYCEVVRFMMQKNPHFRLLALTATPGSNAEVVQSVIDSLHIGHIEVRSDESFDTRQYIHNKRVDLVVIPVKGEIGSIRERFAGLMDILLKQVRDLVKTQKTDPTTMHPYLFQTAMKLVKQSGKPWAFSVLSALGGMARCISKLLEQSVDAFYEDLKGLRLSCKGKASEVINHKDFASIYRDTEDIINGRGFAGHPKMVKLAELVQEHFELAKKEGTLDTTRIMVFCTFRQVVDEIVERLNAFDAIRATRLVGQGTDTKGKKGLAQKEQNATLSKFKKGEFNVLVATSIGEEGLDIGELDLIVCYDAAKSPVRTLQRAGRTGRAREGRVIVLMTEGIEEDNWRIANSKYKDVQNAILSGKQFELYADCQRLVPADIRPAADKKELVIEPFDPEHMGLSRKPVATGRRKRNENDNLDLFETGFQKANGAKIDSKPLKSAAKRKKEILTEPVAPFEGEGLLNEREKQEIHKRLSVRPSTANASPLTLRSQPLPRKVPSPILASKRMLGTSARTASLFRAMQAGQELCADSDKNKAWEIQTYSSFKSSNVRWWPENRVGTGRDRSFRTLGSIVASTKSSIDNPGELATGPWPLPAHSAATLPLIQDDEGMDSSEAELPDISVISSKASKGSPQVPSPANAVQQVNKSRVRGDTQSGPKRDVPETGNVATSAREATLPKSQKTIGKSAAADQTIITIDDSDDDDEQPLRSKAGLQSQRQSVQMSVAANANRPAAATDLEMELDDSFDDDLDSSLWLAVDLARPADKVSPAPATDEGHLPLSPKLPVISRQSAIFRHPADRPSNDTEDSPVVAPRKRAKRMAILTSSPDKGVARAQSRVGPSTGDQPYEDEDESVVLLTTRPGGKRLRRAEDTVAILGRTKHRRKQPNVDAFLDTAAVNSDNEDTASDTDEDIAPETTSDRVFLDSEDIYNPKDMSAFYRESLMSQTADRFQGEVVRPGAYKMRIHRAKILSQCEESPVQDEAMTDQLYEASQYERGSFCVDDSDEVVYSQREDDYLDDD